MNTNLANAEVTKTEALPPGYQQILQQTWPIILANCAVPLLGLVDTAIIGNLGNSSDLGGIALGSLIFSFVFWAFGFLRMGTSGFVAQAHGAEDHPEVRAILGRALLLAAALGLGLILLQWPIAWASLQLFDASPAVEASARDYFDIRIWGAPAALANYALLGLFVGQGQARSLLHLQLFMNGLNIVLDLVFAGILEWGVRGIALGTALSEWCSLLLGLVIAGRSLSRSCADGENFWPRDKLKDRRRLLAMLTANGDIMLRTLLMLAAFGWFTNQSARFGDTVLASNHILLQIISFSAFFLDGFAFTAESLVGRALGAKNVVAFDGAIQGTSRLAVVTALALSLGLLLFGEQLCFWLTDLAAVRQQLSIHLPYAAMYVAVSVGAFQLDGIFIGCTRTRDMRNASAQAVAGFLLICWLLDAGSSNQRLWIAMVCYVVLRALCLAWRMPQIRAELMKSA